MVEASEICRALAEIAPLHLAEAWDNVGLLFGRASREVRRVMTCLTLTSPVAEEAIRRDVQMIVTHHPILFRGTKRITDETSEGAMLLSLAEAGIVVYSPHTAFDSAAEGINQSLAESLGLSQIQPLRALSERGSCGSGRFGELERAVPWESFLQSVCQAVRADYLEFCRTGPELVHRVGIACGAAAEYLNDAAAAHCDTFVTGEARFHAVLECQSLGMNLILTGHYCSERPAVERLAAQLRQRVDGVEFVASESDQNPLNLFRRHASSAGL
jgi:dinuclear metal center YbgI/SA1388 family protein